MDYTYDDFVYLPNRNLSESQQRDIYKYELLAIKGYEEKYGDILCWMIEETEIGFFDGGYNPKTETRNLYKQTYKEARLYISERLWAIEKRIRELDFYCDARELMNVTSLGDRHRGATSHICALMAHTPHGGVVRFSIQPVVIEK